MSFRKLSNQEIANLFGSSQRHGQDLLPIVTTMYERPKEAVSAIVTLDSEYNDETYEHKVQYVGVYDKSGAEIHPLRGKEREARKKMKEAVERMGCAPSEAEDPVEEIVLRMSPVELFVEEPD